jgi:hypothetical protein
VRDGTGVTFVGDTLHSMISTEVLSVIFSRRIAISHEKNTRRCAKSTQARKADNE